MGVFFIVIKCLLQELLNLFIFEILVIVLLFRWEIIVNGKSTGLVF